MVQQVLSALALQSLHLGRSGLRIKACPRKEIPVVFLIVHWPKQVTVMPKFKEFKEMQSCYVSRMKGNQILMNNNMPKLGILLVGIKVR